MIAIITLPFALEAWDSILSVIMCASIAFVGAAPHYKGSDYNIHKIAATTSLICSLIWTAHVCPMYLYLLPISTPIAVCDRKRWLLWSELTCFGMVYLSLIIRL